MSGVDLGRRGVDEAGFVGRFPHQMADRDVDLALAVFAPCLCRLSPTTVEQRGGCSHARGGGVFWLAHDRGEVTDTLLGIRPAQRPDVRWYCFACQCFTGWVPPP